MVAQHTARLGTTMNRYKPNIDFDAISLAVMMRKLLLLTFAILKSGRSYDQNYAPCFAAST
jgi:hypothetical protein